MNPANWLVASAKLHPDNPALFKGETCCATYAEFAARAAAIGAHLQCDLGVQAGDRVAIFIPNCTEYLEALYAVWFAGGVVVPINAKLHPKEAKWIIENAGATRVITSKKYSQALGRFVADDTQLICTDSPEFVALYKTPPLQAPVTISHNQMIWLFYTSGTTGKPKGVMLSSANLTAMALAYFVDVDDVNIKDAILYAAPMSHGAGLYNFMFVMRGSRHVIPVSQGFDTREIFALAPKLQNVSMFAAPTMVRRMLDTAKTSGATGAGIKTIVYGGGPMYLADIIEAVEILGPRFVQIYGLGECPMGITSLSRDQIADRTHPRWRQRLASIGVAQSDVDVQIRNDLGLELPAGEIGEICVSGLPVMSGYWKNSEASKETLIDGWLRTGDMGASDEDGFITLHDRSTDVVISGGTNIYPREVEEALLLHPAVAEVCVVGKPDAEWGEVVVAFVVCNDVDVATLDAHCLDQIARFKRPKFYHFVSELPKNNYGKVLKTKLRTQLKEES